MDDIVIYANSLSEHTQKLKNLLARLRDAGLTLQPDKCHFLRRQLIYLGHQISEDGVKPDLAKVDAVKNFSVPKTKKSVKQFLGLVGYYRRFIKDMAKIARPLTQLLKKDTPFLWGESAQFAFEILRNSLSSEPLLQFPKFSEQFLVTTDTSNCAVGAVLSEGSVGKDLPIAYAPRT